MSRRALTLSLGICTLATLLAGCADKSSNRGGGTVGVEPKQAELLIEADVPTDFAYETTRTVTVEVQVGGTREEHVALVLEPGTVGYEPQFIVTKGKVSPAQPFTRTIRLESSATELPVLLYRDGVFEEAVATIDLDGRATVQFP